MGQVDSVLYFVSALLQLAAMFFAIRMAGEISDRRPWIILFAALLTMFVARVIALSVPIEILKHFNPILATGISLLLLIAMFAMRRVALAERESRLTAERRTAERDESENRYQALVDLSPDAMFVNAGNKIVYANDAALKFFKATTIDDLIGRSPLNLVTPGSRPSIEARIGKLLEIGDKVPPTNEDWLRFDGSEVPAEVVAAVVPWRGGKAIQVILRDISERKRAEDEKTRLLANERSARTIAEHASRMKDEFLATLSHELRTPLTAILGWSHILKNSAVEQNDMDRGLDVIERNARAQTQLIEDLLDMSRIVSGKLRLHIQRLAPATCIEAAIESVKPAADAKGVRLEQIIDPGSGPISGDPQRLQQVVWNLLSNAIKFTPRGGKVQVILQRVNSHVEIVVADTGEGINAVFLPYIFDRFRQADASTTRRHGGLGLGLAIVKQLVELHGGTVRAVSPGEGLGCTFTVEIPLAVVAIQKTDGDRVHPTAVIAATDGMEVDLQGVRVLVVDDEPDALQLIRHLLESHRAEVFSADSALMGAQALKREKPHVLISDIGMPDKDGYEFIREIRALDEAAGGKIPAVALTAFARSEDRKRSMMAGYQVHISKPVEPGELIATVASLMGRTGKS
jgi:PAS domain S-box-containing protein